MNELYTLIEDSRSYSKFGYVTSPAHETKGLTQGLNDV